MCILSSRVPSHEAVPQCASIALAAMFCVAGCSTLPQTRIDVKVPVDSRASKYVGVEDVFRIVASTAKQFGLNASESEFDDSQVCYKGLPSDDYDEGIWLTVSPNEIPLLVAITDGGSSHRSARHRKLADALVTNLNRAGLIASVTFHTPDPGDGVWMVFCALGACAGWLVWRAFRYKQAVLRNTTT
jgi:hypothetical protein